MDGSRNRPGALRHPLIDVGARRRVDAVVAGGSLAGLVAAAVLARRGWEVVVLEATPHLGSRVGAMSHAGYWIDWGHRDGHGIGDLALAPVFARRAAQAAGIDLPLRPFVGDRLRVHWLPERRVTELPLQAVVGTEADPSSQVIEACRCFGLATGREEAVARKVVELMGRLAAISEEEAWELVPQRLDDWLRRQSDDPDVRRVVLQQNALVPLGPGESLGRFVLHLHARRQKVSAAVLDHEEVGGTQGLVRSFGDAVVRHGGEIWLDHKPVEIVVEHNEVRGVVALDPSSLVQVVEAPIVVTDHLGTELGALLDPALLPAGFMEAAVATERFATEMGSWWAGLRRMPRVRASGEVEDCSSPWQRIFWGTGEVRRVYGGWMFPSEFSRRAAPQGRHLLTLWTEPLSESGRPGWRSWSEAQAALDTGIDYLDHYYADLGDCLEWSRYQWVPRPAWLGWYARSGFRHPIRVSTIDGLYVAGADAEGTGGFLDVECATGLEAAELATAERARSSPPAPGPG